MSAPIAQHAVQSLDDLFCSALRGELPPWPGEGIDVDAVIARAHFQGVGVLLHGQASACHWPEEIVAALHQYALQQTMWELRHQHILHETLAALRGRQVEPVLFKGSALAYWLYREPGLRSRSDTDLIIPVADIGRTHEALLALGFQRHAGVSGEFASYQASYTKHTPEGSAHSLDLHWKINNSEVLSKLFTYDEMRESSRQLPQLAPNALGTSPPLSLALACMHRATHKVNPYYDAQGLAHHTADRLIWLYDIHLLAAAMQPHEWNEFLSLARAKGLRAVCLDGLLSARKCFRSEIPQEVLEALSQPGPAERPAQYLNSGRLRQSWMDILALPNTAARLRLMRELTFPPAAYMRSKYPDDSATPLRWLYLRRGASGILKRLQRSLH